MTPTETAYMKYLRTPRTTREITTHFDVAENAAWQIIRTLRLKRLAHRVRDSAGTYWKITEDGDNVPPIPVTKLQMEYIEYLRTQHTTTEMVAHLGKSEYAVQQVTRTLRLLGYVESLGFGSQEGCAGCWKLWKSTSEGIKTLGDEE